LSDGVLKVFNRVESFRTDNAVLHDREVALGARQAREELERNDPGVRIRNDPAAGLNIDVVDRQQVIQEAAAAAMAPLLVRPRGNQVPDRRLEGVKCYDFLVVIDIQEK
jgi:hypothetical protein